MPNTSVQIPDTVPQHILQQLHSLRLMSVQHDGITFIASRRGERITAKVNKLGLPVAVYNKNGKRTDTRS